MKMLTFFGTAGLLLCVSVACRPTNAAPAQVFQLKVEGMTCPVGCAPQVEKQLASVDGVRKVEVDFEAKRATVETSKIISPDSLLAALKEPFQAEVLQSPAARSGGPAGGPVPGAVDGGPVN